MKTKMYKFLAIAKQLMFAVMLLFVLVFGWKQSQAGPRVQSGPTLNVSPGSGLAGSTVTLTGSGYIPGGYDGTLRWDGADRAIFPIPDGGSFSISFTIPASASLGVHTITACSGSPCFTGEFEQLASASFEVTPQVPAIEADVFYGTEGQVPIQIALDEIGVLAQEGISTQEIQNVLGQKYGLQLGDEYPRGILRFKLANAQPRDDLVNLTRTILANDNSLVAQAGLVLPPLGLEPVAITSDQFIVQFNPM
ncbi:MAG: hypothetical protein GY796_30325 [Chloroflexi bacterium]|nr:hypothetical protein [Chloroflexota bacterium]